MEKLYFYSILLSLFLLQFPSLVLVTSNYTPPDKYFINCGSKSNVIVADSVGDRTFIGDLNSSSFIVGVGVSKTVKDKNPLADPNSLYQTARVYEQPYFFELEINQKGFYLLRLHFFAFTTSDTNLSDAVFNVTTSNFSLLSNFSVKNSSNNSAVIKEFLLTIDVGKFRVYFMPVQKKSVAFVNAMEVFIVPDDSLRDNLTHITPVGPNGTVNGLQSHAYRTVHRVNVGGQSVNDTLWRNWMSDHDYLFSGEKFTKLFSSSIDRLKYDVFEDTEELFGATEEYSAPNLVYTTCREVVAVGSNFSKITWQFNVSKSAMHLVRAHFCDIVSESPNVLKFNLYIHNKFTQLIYPYEYITDLAAPFYYEFVVDSDESGIINISVGTMENSLTKAAYLNGLEIMEFMKPYSGTLPPQVDQKKKKPYTIIGSVSGAAIVFILIIVCLWVLICRKKSKPVETMDSVYMAPYGGGLSPYNWTTEKTATASPVPNLNLKLKMPLVEILDATQNFDTKLLIGEGGFGKVYKGTLRSGQKVAVKRSDSRHGQGLPEFQTEIILLSKIRHRHLVSLIGYCDEGSEMILVYEFMENGTLREHLYNSTGNTGSSSTTLSKLTWKQRLEICIGSAKGLHYLHTGAEGGIIHRDVKSTNILLDEHYVAKVADFGLSRSIPLDPDNFSMGVKGSFGYFDPEYFRSLQFTDKSDVYSFGVVLLEVLCARLAIINSSRREEVNLADWGMFWQRKGQLEKIIDPMLVGQINPNSLRKFGEIFEKCLKANGADRPAMCDVMWDLEYALQLQRTAVLREPHEDSTTDASSNLEMPVVRRFPSNDFPIEEDDVSMGEYSGSQPDRGVFSQLSIAAGR